MSESHRVANSVADKLLGIDVYSYTDRVLVCSTSMIPRSTSIALGEDSHNRFNAQLWNILAYEHWGEYGWIISVGVSEVDGHPELEALLKFSDARGFRYLQLDSLSEVLPPDWGFPTFDW